MNSKVNIVFLCTSSCIMYVYQYFWNCTTWPTLPSKYYRALVVSIAVRSQTCLSYRIQRFQSSKYRPRSTRPPMTTAESDHNIWVHHMSHRSNTPTGTTRHVRALRGVSTQTIRNWHLYCNSNIHACMIAGFTGRNWPEAGVKCGSTARQWTCSQLRVDAEWCCGQPSPIQAEGNLKAVRYRDEIRLFQEKKQAQAAFNGTLNNENT